MTEWSAPPRCDVTTASNGDALVLSAKAAPSDAAEAQGYLVVSRWSRTGERLYSRTVDIGTGFIFAHIAALPNDGCVISGNALGGKLSRPTSQRKGLRLRRMAPSRSAPRTLAFPSLCMLIRPCPDQSPLVSLELFFTGNDDLGSIGCNLADHPGVDKFRDVFLGIRARADVSDVLVAISDEMTEDEWPFSDTVVIVTSASTDDVRSWVDELEPDDVMNPERFPLPNLPMQIPPGMRYVTV